jgi:hypothetical protein
MVDELWTMRQVDHQSKDQPPCRNRKMTAYKSTGIFSALEAEGVSVTDREDVSRLRITSASSVSTTPESGF